MPGGRCRLDAAQGRAFQTWEENLAAQSQIHAPRSSHQPEALRSIRREQAVDCAWRDVLG
jgi:hypothetical protein